MKYSALVPVKRLALAKSRLSGHLSRKLREMLVLDMLQHVVSTLCESDLFEQVYVVSADVQVLELVQDWGAEPLREMQPGHNPALQAAAQLILERAAWRHRIQTSSGPQAFLAPEYEERLWARGSLYPVPQAFLAPEYEGWRAFQASQSIGLLTISADLPLLSQEDVRALLTSGERSQVVLAASTDGTGTNAILMRPPLVLPYLFGPNSLHAYVQAARQHQVGYTLVHNAGLALDIDTQEDLHELEQSSRAWSRMADLAIS